MTDPLRRLIYSILDNDQTVDFRAGPESTDLLAYLFRGPTVIWSERHACALDRVQEVRAVIRQQIIDLAGDGMVLLWRSEMSVRAMPGEPPPSHALITEMVASGPRADDLIHLPGLFVAVQYGVGDALVMFINHPGQPLVSVPIGVTSHFFQRLLKEARMARQ